MDTSKKNKPAPVIVIGISVIVLMIIFYFIVLSFFPDLFQSLNVGEAKPVNN